MADSCVGLMVRWPCDWLYVKQEWKYLLEARGCSPLLPIILKVMVCDCGRRMVSICNYPNIPGNYSHYTVNHSQHFVNPMRGDISSTLRAKYCSRLKRSLKRMNGTSNDLAPRYIDEYMWCKRYGNFWQDQSTCVHEYFEAHSRTLTMLSDTQLISHFKRLFSGPPIPIKENDVDVNAVCIILLHHRKHHLPLNNYCYR